MKIDDLLLILGLPSRFSTCDVLTKEETGLPVLIKYDGWHVWKEKYRHTIQVQNDYSSEFGKKGFLLSIEDKPKIVLGRCKLKREDLIRVKIFIYENKERLIKLIDFEDGYEREKFIEDILNS